MSALTPGQRAALDALLAAHEAADGAERESLARIRRFAAEETDPFDRRLARGHLTGSAFVQDPAGRILLLHHRKLGIWVQLGGHADAERDAAVLAAREAREESGLTDLAFHPALRLPDGAPALLDADVHRIPARGPEPAHWHYDLRFLMGTSAPDALLLHEGEGHELAWVSADEARRRCDPGIARAVAKIERLGPSGGAESEAP